MRHAAGMGKDTMMETEDLRKIMVSQSARNDQDEKLFLGPCAVYRRRLMKHYSLPDQDTIEMPKSILKADRSMVLIFTCILIFCAYLRISTQIN